MPLKLVIDKLEDVEESLRPLYAANKDGKLVLDVDGVEDTDNLKNALKAERKSRTELEKKVAKWEKLGKTDEEIAALLEAHEKDEVEKLSKAGEWDKLKAQMNTAHETALAAKDKEIASLRGRLQSELVDKTAVAAIAAAKGVPDLLLPHVQRHVKVDDEFNVKVVDAKGDPRVNPKGEPLTITDLVEEMRGTEIYGRAFEGSGQSGSGMRPPNGGGGPVAIKTRAQLKSNKEKADFVDAFGSEAYDALPLR